MATISKISMEQAVTAAIRQRAEEIAVEETEKVAKRIRERMSKELASILLGVAKIYDMEMLGDRVVITVRNPSVGGE